MAIKSKEVLSRDDFREAIDAGQISISQIAKATGIPRSYLSEFLSIGRRLKPEQLQAVRDFLEGEGVEFEASPAVGSRGADELPPSLAIANICHFPILPDRVSEAKAVLAEIDANDKRIAELLDKPAVRETGAFSSSKGQFTEKTDQDIRELYGLCAANYMFFRYLTLEKNPLSQGGKEYTLRSVFIEIAKASLDKAGVDTTPPAPLTDDESSPEETAA